MSKPNFTKREIANLHSSYRSAIYEVYHGEETIQLSIGQHNPNLDRLLEEYDRHTGALITAFNPYSQCLSAAENEQRHRSLIKYLEPLKLTIFDAVGKDQDGVWTPEQSVFILGVELVDARQRVAGVPPVVATVEGAIALGNRFQQNAIVFGELGKAVGLVWL